MSPIGAGALLPLLPALAGLGWVVRVPLLSPEEGHEAITRQAWDGLGLARWQEEALIHGVRAPDVGLAGILVTGLPFAQRRHALRGWYGQSTADAVRAVRDWVARTHDEAVAMPDGPSRWRRFGAVLHCIQDSYSPAHTERVDGRITYMRHWGPLDRLRGTAEHGFPTDRRDRSWDGAALSAGAVGAAEASRAYLEQVSGESARGLDTSHIFTI